MLEPSKPSPSSNMSSDSSPTGIEKCCQVPGRSVKRTSTTWTPDSFARRITSAGLVEVLGDALFRAVFEGIVAVIGAFLGSGRAGL